MVCSIGGAPPLYKPEKSQLLARINQAALENFLAKLLPDRVRHQKT